MLGRRWQRRWRRHGGRRRQTASVVVACLLAVTIFACGPISGSDWPALEADARGKLRDGLFDESLKGADQGYRESGRDTAWNWKFKTLKAEGLLRKGMPEPALALVSDEPPTSIPADVAARKRIVQGQALCYLNRIPEAETILTKAESLIGPSEQTRQGELAFQRGMCALRQDPKAAQRHFEDAIRLTRGHDDFIAASALIGSGYMLFKSGRCGNAITEFEKALSLTGSRLLRERALGNLAECQADLGDWRQSVSSAEQAEKLAAQINNVGDQEVWLIDVGRGHLALHELSEAEPYYRRALAIARKLNDTDAVWRCLNNLTHVALARHDLPAAEGYWKEESGLNLSAEGKAFVTFDAAKIAMERKEFSRAEQLLKEVLNVKTSDSLRLTAQRELGNVYWHEGKNDQADRTFREAIANAEAAMRRLPPEHRISFLDVDPFYDSCVRFLAAQNKPEEALKAAERGRAQILSQALEITAGAPAPFNVTTLQTTLKKQGQIALAYSLTDDESFLWVVTPTQIKLLRLPSHRQLRPLVDAYNREIVEDPRAIEDSPGGQALYKTLIQPAEGLIPKGSRVVIITSKILSLVNFEALIVPGAHPHYWIEDVEIQTASSLSMISRSRPAPRLAARNNKKQLLLLGAPIEADNSFPALKHASEEITRVRSHFPDGLETIISGKDAVPASYRASRPGEYRLIHIDAHSSPSDLSPLDSYIVLSPAGGKDSHKLSAREITQTPLQAELVTISACYGAGTRWYQGEGIVGLGWAFLRAGAHQVVASLWAVDDASTPQLMDDFYDALSKGKPAASALRDAKLRMLHSSDFHKRPYYWASLQLYTGARSLLAPRPQAYHRPE